ncbi:MAG TPA: preprotein translocase subunit SecG [Methylophilaceae bacterium]|nr:preprotein translocase subunit SecG [Methylophilaceae bacterium]
METLVLIIHVLASIGVIGMVLLQHGKGADMGAAFGSGASGSLFGVSGSSNFMSRATAIFVTIFFATSLTLAYFSSHDEGRTSVIKLQDAATPAPAKAADLPGDVVKPAQPAPAEPSAKDVPQ